MNTFEVTSWDVAFQFENVLVDHRPEVVYSYVMQNAIKGAPSQAVTAAHALKKLYPAAQPINLEPVQDALAFMCCEYLVQDYSNVDLRKIADMCIHYPKPVLERVAMRCRAQGIYTIAYLAAALTSEAGTEIMELRREARLQEIALAGKPTVLPPRRAPKALLRSDPLGAAENAHLERRLAGLQRNDNE